MINIEQNLQIIQILIPSICIGVLFIGMIFCVYVYINYPIDLYLSIIYLGIIGVIFVLAELITAIMIGWNYNKELSSNVHMFGQMVLPFLLFLIPFFISKLLKLNEKWKRINKVIIIVGMVCAISLFIFYSITTAKYLFNSSNKSGILVTIRNFGFILLIIYTLVIFAVDFMIHKNHKATLLPFLGFILVSACTMDDIIYIHWNRYTGLLSHLPFSRFAVGFSIFILFSMIIVIKQFITLSKRYSRTYDDLTGAHKALHKSEERFRQLAENLNEIFITFDYKNNVVLYVSPAYENMWGRTCDSLYESPMSFFNSVHKDDIEDVNSKFRIENIQDNFELKFRVINNIYKTLRWIRMKVFIIRDINNIVYRLTGIIEDITESKKAEDELTFIAYHDIITGLPNRRSFYEKFYDLLLQENRSSSIKDKALFYVDLDRFKYVNETLGREYGDELLKDVSKRMKQCLRKNDYIYRLDSDEFIIILNTIANNLDPAIVAKKLIDVLSVPFTINNREIFVGLCIGISIYPRDGEDVEKLLRNADIALNEAKKDRNSYRFFNDSMNKNARERSKIEYSMRYAIEKGEISLNYQPVVDISKKIISMEALIRWNHPELGPIPPDKFIPIAEATGQIIDIGEWVIRESCEQLKAWHDMGFINLKIAINLSAKQFRDELLIEKINGILDEVNLSAKYIEFEITESSVMENPDEAQNKISDLNTQGVTFSIDDFGTGYSSFAYLKKFKIDCLKVDRSFIKDILIDEDNTEITRAIIAMAHNLNLRVVAEGVETIEQMDFLKSIDCDAMQGFYFSKPVTSEEFLKLLKNGFS